MEIINGGFGIKNPLANDTPAAVDPNRGNDRLNATSASSDPTKFQCRLCSKVFNLQRLLNRHMKCHSDTKRYLCTFCGKGFNDTFDLKRHTRTHTGNVTTEMNIYMNNNAQALNIFLNHFFRPLGVRPYKCNLCEKSFTQRCSLESHCMKVHGVAHSYEYKQRRSKVNWS